MIPSTCTLRHVYFTSGGLDGTQLRITMHKTIYRYKEDLVKYLQKPEKARQDERRGVVKSAAK